MAENNKIEETKKIEDENLDKATGGSLFSRCSNEEYEAAGVEIIDPGVLWNGDYKLKETGEWLDNKDAYYAVKFFKDVGRPAHQKAEIFDLYRNAYTGSDKI